MLKFDPPYNMSEHKGPVLTTLWDTYFKKNPLDSSKQKPEDLVFVKAGEKVNLNWHRTVENNHVEVSLSQKLEGFHNWFLFKGAVSVEGNEVGNDPKEEELAPVKNGPKILIPGEGSVFVHSKIISGGNFTWAEATKNGTRIPENSNVTRNIKRIAEQMENVRSLCGNRPIIVTSWYRPPAINRAVGGSRYSRHIQGDAVDYYVKGMSTSAVYSKLNPWWGSQGGLAQRPGSFIHIDARSHRARWQY